MAISNPIAADHSSQAASSAIDDLLGLGLPGAAPATPSPQLKLNTKAVPGSKHISAEVAPIADALSQFIKYFKSSGWYILLPQ